MYRYPAISPRSVFTLTGWRIARNADSMLQCGIGEMLAANRKCIQIGNACFCASAASQDSGTLCHDRHWL
jgi:hypothetical protein